MVESPSNRSMKDTRCLKPGVILKQRYRILNVIGAGGFGITYRAYDPVLRTYVAIKEYYPLGIAEREPNTSQVCVPVSDSRTQYYRGMVRFLQEAQDAARFQSEPNIVSIYDYLEENDTAYIVMEYLYGCTVKQYAKDHGGVLDTDMLLHIGLSAADALHTVHESGMIHRDISPENLFLCEDLTIRLIDFGAAKQIYLESDQTVSVVLKPNYAPPEQYGKGDSQGPWTDVYALGATLYYLATGEKPEESMSRVTQDTLVRADRKNPALPAYFVNVIEHAMSVQISQRYQSANEMKEALIREAEYAELEAKPVYDLTGGDIKTSSDGLHRTKKRLLLTGCLLAALFVGIIWIVCKNALIHTTPIPDNAENADAVSTLTDAALASGSDAEADSDAQETEKKQENGSPMVMQVPTKEELADEQHIDGIITVISTETEGAKYKGFSYSEDADKGYYLLSDGMQFSAYTGDCFQIEFEYYDGTAVEPKGEDLLIHSLTLERYNDDYGIYNETVSYDKYETAAGLYDYAGWYLPGYDFRTNGMTVYIPAGEELEDGRYRLYFACHDSYADDNEDDSYIFQITIEFYLYRAQ